MKPQLIALLITVSINILGQDKYNYVHFNKLTEVSGTEYVIASIENWEKMLDTKSKFLLFINTKTGQTKQIDFPNNGHIEKIEQVKIDSLDINKIIVSAKTIDMNAKKEIDWEDMNADVVRHLSQPDRTFAINLKTI